MCLISVEFVLQETRDVTFVDGGQMEQPDHETSVENVKIEEKETALMTPEAPRHIRRHEITRFPRGLFKKRE